MFPFTVWIRFMEVSVSFLCCIACLRTQSNNDIVCSAVLHKLPYGKQLWEWLAHPGLLGLR